MKDPFIFEFLCKEKIKIKKKIEITVSQRAKVFQTSEMKVLVLWLLLGEEKDKIRIDN